MRCRSLLNSICWFCWFPIFFLFAQPEGSVAMNPVPDPAGIILPKSIDGWTRPDAPRKISSKNIFDYMDGAGELYIGYRFKYLDVYEYASRDEDQILVELYWMESSDDAFGLLSGDWGGDPVDLGRDSPGADTSRPWSGKRALYGSGLLRLWSDTLYARVMAYQETPKSKAVLLKLGRAIAARRGNPPPPPLLDALPMSIDAGFKLRTDRVSYFRSHLVLNSIYFLSPGNILGLELSGEAVNASYAPPPGDGSRRAMQLLLVRYRDAETARKALGHFEKIYLPERQIATRLSTPGRRLFWQIEDGWLGYGLHRRTLAIVFESPRRETAAQCIDEAMKKLNVLEATHE